MPSPPTEPAAVQVVVHSGSTEVVTGSTAQLNCVGYGEPVPSFSWFKSGIHLNNDSDSRITITEQIVVDSNITFVHSSLEVCNTQIWDASTYECVAHNGITNHSASFQLDVVAFRGKGRTFIAAQCFMILHSFPRLY